MATIHRAGLNARPLCGAAGGGISLSGARQFITCPECRKLEEEPSREEAERQIQKAAERFHQARAMIAEAEAKATT